MAITELFPDLRSREDNSGALLSEIDELQRALTEAKTELARLKGLLESERNRSDELAKRCDDQERMLQGSTKVTVVDNSKVQELEELQEKMQQEVDAQAERMSKMIKDLAAGKSYDLGRSRKDPSKVFPKLDEAIADLDKLFAKIAKDTPQVVEKVSGDGGESLARAQKEIQQLKQEIAALKSKLAAAEQREQDALAKLKDAQKKPPPAEKAKMPESPSNTGIMSDNVDELKQQLERKIARVAELEGELAQAKKDLRAAQRTIDEKDLLLQERARKDADKAKHMSELMEKLRKSEEEAEKLAAKLYKAEEKIKQLKEQIRELKNQLGLPQEQSEEEVEEEVDTGTAFMSRYYLRAKNSRKPRWMLLSEDAKYKSQKKTQDESKQVVGGGPLPVGQMGMGWAGGAQPQEASRAFNFLRKAPGASPSRAGTQVRLQYSFTQASSLAEGPDASPASSQAAGAFNRMNTIHGGPMQDTPHSPMAGQEAQRLMHSNSMPFSAGPDSAAFHGGISRQSTSNSLVPGSNGPNVYVPRANTPPLPHPIYAAGGGSVFHNANWRGGQAAPSTGPAFTSNMAGPMGPAMSNPLRQEGGMPNLGGIRLGTPPILNPSGLNGLQGPSAPAPAGPAGHAGPGPQQARAAPIVEATGSSSLAVAGFSQSLGKPSPSGSPGSTRPSDEDVPTSSAGLPLMLPSEPDASRELRHSSSSLSLSPASSSRVAHVGLAMIDPMSPQDRPMLQLIPQSGASQDLPFMMDSMEVSAARAGASRTLERQAASWSSFPSSWGFADASQGLSGPPAVVNLSMPQNPSLPGPDLSPSQDQVPSKEGNQVPVHRPMLHSTTVPLDILDQDFITASTPILPKAATSSKVDGTGSGSKEAVASAPAAQGDSVDMLIQHAKSQPLSGSVRPEASSFVSWVAPRSNGPKPLTNGSLPLTNSFKGKARSMKSTSNLESPVQYIQADSLPRLPGGKVRKAPQPQSWLTPL